MEDYRVSNDIEYLKGQIMKLENRSIDMKLAFIQICIEIGWTDEQIKNVIGASDNELEFFRKDVR